MTRLHTRRRLLSGRSGFTLIEIIISLGIMVLIASITWSTLASTIKMRDFLDEEDGVNRSSRVALDRISREISLAFLTSNTSAINTYQTVFIGRDDTDTDMVWFATMAHRRRTANTHECDQAEITLWTEDDPDHAGRVALLHRESQRIDEKPDEDGAINPIARNVTRFDLRYLDPETAEWKDEWDTTGTETPNRLPRAVEVVLSIMGPDPDDPDEEIEHTFVRTVLLEAGGKMEQSLLNNAQKGIGESGLSSGMGFKK